jgi:hypothetical protein
MEAAKLAHDKKEAEKNRKNKLEIAWARNPKPVKEVEKYHIFGSDDDGFSEKQIRAIYNILGISAKSKKTVTADKDGNITTTYTEGEPTFDNMYNSVITSINQIKETLSRGYPTPQQRVGDGTQMLKKMGFTDEQVQRYLPYIINGDTPSYKSDVSKQVYNKTSTAPAPQKQDNIYSKLVF